MMTADALFCDFPLATPAATLIYPLASAARSAMLAQVEATDAAMRRGEAFRRRVCEAGTDLMALADLMAEAIDWARDVTTHPQQRRNQGITASMADLEATYCLDAARAAYGAAKLAALNEAAKEARA